MQIYVGKNGQQLGPFSLEEVNRKLADGTFTGSDLAWYEGAAGWASLSGVAGVVIPAPAAPAPTPAPTSIPIQPAPAIRPVQPAAVPVTQGAPKKTGALSTVAWVLIGITFIVSFIPVVGCGAWLLATPVAIVAIILGIIIITRGRTGQGIMAILGGLLIVPLCFLAQFLSLIVFGGTIERKEQSQIKDNLVLIDSAKTRWVTETKASNGTPVTMASLKSQLGGKEVKPAVGETYDPMPVGQAPTATLPANTTLGTFSGGDILTAASIEKALANSSAFNWNLRKSTTVSPSPTTSLSLPSPKPTASAEPSVTVSPKPSVAPSVSPKSSSAPHQLISPRQRPDSEETPSSRPSPSAKFAPRTGPRRSPSPSDRPESDNSGAPRQGRQQPRESPAETPETTPDDDDDGDE